MTHGPSPRRVEVRAQGERHPAVALELTGHRAALLSSSPLVPDTEVVVGLEWEGGARTSLPAVVRVVAPYRGEHVAHVELCGVDGDWEPFLAYVGPCLAP